jgi:ribosome-interacting GTPase 1
MPANLTPEYRRAEAAFRAAKTTEEKIECLEEMLRTIPKHKGTDHMQGDLKRRLAQLRRQPRTRPAGSRPNPYYVPKTGAGQVVLLGPPNSGKTALVAALTNAKVEPAPYPFATTLPAPGMYLYEEVPIELVDTPPVTPDYFENELLSTVRECDVIAPVADASSPAVLEDVEMVLAHLAEREIVAVGRPFVESDLEEADLVKPCFVVASKCDLAGAGPNVEALRDLYGDKMRVIAASVETKQGLDEIGREALRLIDVIRVYAKPPGREVDRAAPFCLKRGSTVLDMAREIHRDLPETLKKARVWGSSKFGGQTVPKDYVLTDRDVVELAE